MFQYCSDSGEDESTPSSHDDGIMDTHCLPHDAHDSSKPVLNAITFSSSLHLVSIIRSSLEYS